MSLNKNEKGFGLIETLLVIIALALVVFVGYYIYQNQQDSKEEAVMPKSVSAKTVESETDPTEDWKTYTSTAGKYTLKYPSTWVTASNPDLCDEKMFLLGPTEDSVGRCASDGGGEMMFYSYTVESGPQGLQDEYYENIETKVVTVDGVKGQRQSGTVKNDTEGIGPEKGTKEIVYTFKKNGQIYTAQYTQNTNYPDVQKEFDLIVTKTLKFDN